MVLLPADMVTHDRTNPFHVVTDESPISSPTERLVLDPFRVVKSSDLN